MVDSPHYLIASTIFIPRIFREISRIFENFLMRSGLGLGFGVINQDFFDQFVDAGPMSMQPCSCLARRTSDATRGNGACSWLPLTPRFPTVGALSVS